MVFQQDTSGQGYSPDPSLCGQRVWGTDYYGLDIVQILGGNLLQVMPNRPLYLHVAS